MKAGITTRFKKSLRTRAFRAGAYSVFAGLLVAAIAVALNLIVSALPSSVTQRDVTASGLYTVSEQTRQIVSGLTKDVAIYWLVQPTTEEGALERLLENYKELSPRVSVKKIDPVEFPNFAAEYTDEKIYNNTLIVVCGGRNRVLGYYDIFKYDYQSDYYGASGYGYDVSFAGEEALTSALDYVTSEDLPVAYALSGHGEAKLPDSLASLIEGENYELKKELSLLSLESVPEDCDLLIINAPQSDLSGDDADKLSAYLKGGGKLMLVTGLYENGAKLANLEGIASYYGVSEEEGIVIEGDPDYTIWNYNYYLLPDLDATHEITAPLAEAGYRALLPVARGLTVSVSLREGLRVTKLLTPSESSFVKPEGLAITSYDKEEGDKDGPFALAVAISEGDTRIVWLSSAMALDESTDSSVSGANYDLFVNSLGWLAGKRGGVSIRAKSLEEARLTVASGEAARMSVIMIGVLPTLTLGVGIYVFARRKRR